MHVTHDSDDMQQMQVAIHSAELDLPANRVFVRPVTVRQRLTDERCMGGTWPVRVLEKTAAQKRNADSGEITGTGDAKFRIAQPVRAFQSGELLLELSHRLRRLRAIFDNEPAAGAVATQRQRVHSAQRNNTGQRLESLEELLVNLRNKNMGF